MPNHPVFSLLAIFFLILCNGIFAMAEISIVSARKALLEKWAKEGDEGAKAALLLSNHPHCLLATVQIGMTLTSILIGVFGGATISNTLSNFLKEVPGLEPYAPAMGFTIVVLAISYLTLILGELSPKRVGLANAEKIACVIAPSMWWLSRIAQPLIKFLNDSCTFVVNLLRIKESAHPPITTEEINLLIAHGTRAGVFQEAEECMVKGVLRLSGRPITALMTPRPQLICLDINETQEQIRQILLSSPPDRILICDGHIDNLIGFVFSKHAACQLMASNSIDLKACLAQPLFVPENVTALQLLDQFKHTGNHFAIVLNEYGGVEGVATMTDMFKGVVGGLDSLAAVSQTKLVEHECCWLLDGYLPIDQFKLLTGIDSLPDEMEAHYHTLAGFIIHLAKQLPSLNDTCESSGYRFRVISMRGRRIERVGLERIVEDLDDNNSEQSRARGSNHPAERNVTASH